VHKTIGRAAVLAAAMLSPALASAHRSTTPAGSPAPRPWRADEALGVPWLGFGVEHRVRVESLGNDFRAAHEGDAQAVSMRTLLATEVRLRPVYLAAELADSRAWMPTPTPVSTTHVDTLALLRAQLVVRGTGVLRRGDTASIAIGRMTIDLGSRRLIARNEFRNTINAFTGVDMQWTSPRGAQLRGLVVMPVQRRPGDEPALRDNRFALDRENVHALVWAVAVASRPLFDRSTVEAQVIGLHERDGGRSPSSERQLATPVVRWIRPPTAGELDYQLEAMAQLGRSRASPAATDTADLVHLAWAAHGSVGFRFDRRWAPRVVLAYDHASGDAAPDDRANNRFDPLFGARRFDFGPTGIYGVIARSNLASPTARLELQPRPTIDALAAYRAMWLASPRDAWTTAGVRDERGRAGRFIGHHLEARVRWHAQPGNLSFDLGGALLLRGGFARRAPGGRDAPAAYFYLQITVTI
jgi:hypothetical protein